MGARSTGMSPPKASPTLRADLLTWFGVLGGAATLLAGLQNILVLADWIHAIIGYWTQWMRVWWSSIFGWLGVDVPSDLYPVLTFAVFAIAVGIGAHVSVRSTDADQRSDTDVEPDSAPGIPSGRRNTALILLAVTIAVLWIVYWGSTQYFWLKHTKWDSDLLSVLYFCPALLWIALAQDRARALQIVVLMAAFSVVLMFLPIPDWMSGRFGSSEQMLKEFFDPPASALDPWGRAWDIALLGAIVFHCLIVFLLVYAPIRGLARRLQFIAIGFILLLALNEAAKLNLSRYVLPPKAAAFVAH